MSGCGREKPERKKEGEKRGKKGLNLLSSICIHKIQYLTNNYHLKKKKKLMS